MLRILRWVGCLLWWSAGLPAAAGERAVHYSAILVGNDEEPMELPAAQRKGSPATAPAQGTPRVTPLGLVGQGRPPDIRRLESVLDDTLRFHGVLSAMGDLPLERTYLLTSASDATQERMRQVRPDGQDVIADLACYPQRTEDDPHFAELRLSAQGGPSSGLHQGIACKSRISEAIGAVGSHVRQEIQVSEAAGGAERPFNVVFVVWSGHGSSDGLAVVPTGDRSYVDYIGAHQRKKTQIAEKDGEEGELKLDELITWVRRGLVDNGVDLVVLVLDSCSGPETPPGLRRVRGDKHIVVVRAAEPISEIQEIASGPLIHVVASGLLGGADFNADHVVTVAELTDFFLLNFERRRAGRARKAKEGEAPGGDAKRHVYASFGRNGYDSVLVRWHDPDRDKGVQSYGLLYVRPADFSRVMVVRSAAWNRSTWGPPRGSPDPTAIRVPVIEVTPAVRKLYSDDRPLVLRVPGSGPADYNFKVDLYGIPSTRADTEVVVYPEISTRSLDLIQGPRETPASDDRTVDYLTGSEQAGGPFSARTIPWWLPQVHPNTLHLAFELRYRTGLDPSFAKQGDFRIYRDSWRDMYHALYGWNLDEDSDRSWEVPKEVLQRFVDLRPGFRWTPPDLGEPESNLLRYLDLRAMLLIGLGWGEAVGRQTTFTDLGGMVGPGLHIRWPGSPLELGPAALVGVSRLHAVQPEDCPFACTGLPFSAMQVQGEVQVPLRVYVNRWSPDLAIGFAPAMGARYVPSQVNRPRDQQRGQYQTLWRGALYRGFGVEISLRPGAL